MPLALLNRNERKSEIIKVWMAESLLGVYPLERVVLQHLYQQVLRVFVRDRLLRRI